MEHIADDPSIMRNQISRDNLPYPTHGWCKGYLQANISIVPSSVADDFERFCELNPSACPLLYRSYVGEISAPPLADHSDIRTQVGKYWYIKNGELQKEVTNLYPFALSEMVTFYLGCSFGMEDALEAAGVKLPKNVVNVSMFVTNIACHQSGPFSANMVVSMRSVPIDLLEEVYRATYTLDCCHGAPVHIGDPTLIGISDIYDVDFGVPTVIKEDEIPVFFACGVTGNKALQSAGLPVCLTHSPGHMFICDKKTEEFQQSQPSPYEHLVPRVVQINFTPARFSVASKKTLRKIKKLENVLLIDIGDRGVHFLAIRKSLLKSLLQLYQSSSVGITFGFPVFGDEMPDDLNEKLEHSVEETDGIPGAIDIAKALLALNKNVSFIIDKRNESLMRTVIDRCLFTHCLPKSVPILVYERTADRKSTAVKFLYPNGRSEKPRFDHLVAIERTAPNKHGNYCSMKAEVLREDLIAPIEDIFLEADKDDRISTTCIGDGGNEIGMGKVYESVCSNIRHDEKIASVISCDYLIACGVSNWGGHALAVGLYLLSNCPIHDRYVRRGLVRVTPQKTREDFLNSIKQKEKVLEVLVDEGVRDGVTGISELSVDGFHLYPYHEQHFEYMTNLIDD